MLIDDINALIPSVTKSGDKNRLEAIKDIKVELMKVITSVSKDYQLTKKEEDKILLKMVSQYTEAINEFKKGGADENLIKDTEARLAVIKEYAPTIASDEEIEALTRSVIEAYSASKGANYALSMRDMKPILTEVQKTYPTANGKVISKVLKSKIG